MRFFQRRAGVVMCLLMIGDKQVEGGNEYFVLRDSVDEILVFHLVFRKREMV